MSRRLGQSATVAPSVRTWRATTAVRVFALALAAGQALSAGSFKGAAAILFTLVMIALVSAVLEAGLAGRRSPWIPVVEGIVVATLLVTSLPVDALLVYLAVPPMVAGLRHGWVTTVNTTLTSGAAVLASSVGYDGQRLEVAGLLAAFPWLAIGLGAGLLAAWQSRSVRHLEASQAPYTTAHHLLAQLHDLTRKVGVGLDSPTIAQELAESVRAEAGASAALVTLRSPTGGLEPCARAGDHSPLAEVADFCSAAGRAVTDDTRAGLLLRVQDDVFGVLALDRARGWSDDELRGLQEYVDGRALRLETALLFDEVRMMATSEERNRLAREMHDGVAQEVVALGYLVDEIESQTTEPTALSAAQNLREEISRVVAELRFSIYDLRHEMADQALSGALAEYAREVSAGSDLRVHLTFDEQGPALHRRTEAEVLRVAQEAITNARKHARAINLWVTFATDGKSVSLVVEDDGIGSAGPKDRHYGMHTMRERAERIGAQLTVADRRDGGTVVSLRSTSLSPIGDDRSHEHSRPAGR
jgi:signal transduction histidine kinase